MANRATPICILFFLYIMFCFPYINIGNTILTWITYRSISLQTTSMDEWRAIPSDFSQLTKTYAVRAWGDPLTPSFRETLFYSLSSLLAKSNWLWLRALHPLGVPLWLKSLTSVLSTSLSTTPIQLLHWTSA